MSNLAGLLEEQGRHEEAELLHREEMESSRAKLGEEHPETLTSMNGLATVLQAQRRHDEAQPLHRQALAGRRARLGDSHPETMSDIYNLADLLRAALPRRARAVSVHGAQHKETIGSTKSLAGFLKELGRETEAAELLAGLS
ncbi:Nphp3 [Symbiodinium necroappetens]|uniref:Nphp3 protein n=1 Tax=Symbiodinium necroappetens TaxID=1628268 RepID=A0A812ZY29_9DINO|nr:Nphp3 [Symbiodinium necroappetens]